MKHSIKPRLLPLILLSFALFSCQKIHDRSSASTDYSYARSMADSEMKRNPSAWMLDFQERPKWAYVNGLVCSAMLNVWEQTGEMKYFLYAKGYADSLIDENGSIIGYKKEDFNLDKLNSGKILFTLYKETRDERYRTAIEILYNQLKDQPRTSEGGFWHKKIYPNQMWLDGIYMGTPYYAQYASTFGDSSTFNDIALQFELLNEHARDTTTGWYYHGWDSSREVFWAHPKTGRSQNFWGRGVGWYYMALVDVLDFFPEDHPKRAYLLATYRDLSETIIKNQDSTGLWYQVLNMPEEPGNYLEATCSSQFAYGLIKGIEKRYIDAGYIEHAKEAYYGIIDHLIIRHPNGALELTSCCAGAGLGPANNPKRDGTYEYYINEKKRSNDGKGTGPFIMASLIYENSPSFQINK